MSAVLRPGGIVVVEDGDLTTAGSVPPSAFDLFPEMFGKLGPARGLDYTLGKNLYHMVRAAGFRELHVEIHQPALMSAETRRLLLWSAEEAAPAFRDAGLVSRDRWEESVREMKDLLDDADLLVLAPRMTLVWGRKVW